ncbi:MAG: crossover junction endodeoxyribonuclease RuvC [Planctomycetaceae bacterium]|nr:crossover junction endodeoxyribonuclease RuvC [Planctomycetaceae bacterium]
MGFSIGNAFNGPAPDRYLGIDPGLNRTGYAVLVRTPDGPELEEGGVIRSTPDWPLAQRVAEIGRGLSEVIDEFGPQTVAIEQVFSHGSYPKTAVLMAHARGAILFAAAVRHLPVVHYTPAQIKRLLTGSGRADKQQMQLAVQRELALLEIPEPHDVADACAVALCHYYSARLPVG